MANSVDPDQTSPLGALFFVYLNLPVMLADDFSRRYFKCIFLGTLRVKYMLFPIKSHSGC